MLLIQYFVENVDLDITVFKYTVRTLAVNVTASFRIVFLLELALCAFWIVLTGL